MFRCHINIYSIFQFLIQEHSFPLGPTPRPFHWQISILMSFPIQIDPLIQFQHPTLCPTLRATFLLRPTITLIRTHAQNQINSPIPASTGLHLYLHTKPHPLHGAPAFSITNTHPTTPRSTHNRPPMPIDNHPHPYPHHPFSHLRTSLMIHLIAF